MREIQLNINSEGYKKIDNNIFELNNKILEEFEIIYNDKKYNSNGHKNTAIINDLNELKKFNYLEKLNKNILNLIKNNKIKNIQFDDIWFVKSVESIYEPRKLPYVPHIDKVRKIKAMVYLNDVTIEDGPLFITKVDPNIYENFRKELKPDYKKRQENEVKNLNIKDYSPLFGKFGTTIFFDTNAPHFAGKIYNKSSMRKIIRFNFRVKPENYFKKIVKKIFKINL